MTSEVWMPVKANLLKWTNEERRKYYHCKGNFVELKDVPTWAEYFTKKAGDLPKLKSKDFIDKFSANEEIARKVSLWRGDITLLEIDGIVNAANESLLGGGGVDGCIHRAAGKYLLYECETLDGCDTGLSKTTCGYKLPARYVIHTVGPQGIKPKLLSSCYISALQEAFKHGIRTVAFPCISTGIYGYPCEKAAHVALYEIRKILEKHSDKFDRIIFATFMPKDVKIYEEYMQHYFPLPTTTPAESSEVGTESSQSQSTEDCVSESASCTNPKSTPETPEGGGETEDTSAPETPGGGGEREIDNTSTPGSEGEAEVTSTPGSEGGTEDTATPETQQSGASTEDCGNEQMDCTGSSGSSEADQATSPGPEEKVETK